MVTHRAEIISEARSLGGNESFTRPPNRDRTKKGKPVAGDVSNNAPRPFDVLTIEHLVGLMSQWADVGRYGAPHQMITAVLTFGLIFQQVVFPTLARSWRKTAASSSPWGCS